MRVSDARETIGFPRGDCELLLAKAMGKDRLWVLAHPEEELTSREEKDFLAMARRRRQGEPFAYIIGQKEFYGRTFQVDRSVLVPRPATERLVELALHMLSGKEVPAITDIDNEIVAWAYKKTDLTRVREIVDVGTGSGCIAVTIACERPDLHVVATDIDPNALLVAAKNATFHGVKDSVECVAGTLLQPLTERREPFFLISNPPYIVEGTQLSKDVASYESHTALFAGQEGMDVLRPLVEAAQQSPLCAGWIVECRQEQAHALRHSL